MTDTRYALTDIGFSAHFRSQLSLEELEHTTPLRVVEVQRDRVTAIGEVDRLELALSGNVCADSIAIGDWLLVDKNKQLVRLLEPKSSLRRRASGTSADVQLIANNVDTLFVVTSCNADFNEARLERYLALAKEAEMEVVIVLTKADLSAEVSALQCRAEALMENINVLPLDATAPTVPELLAPWCGPGQTVALVGSSGVGKTTLLNALTGESLETQEIREDDAKGRHTTTFRAMRPILKGGWIIDTPGMRALRLYDSAEGIDAVFDDVVEAATHCRFADCQHGSEPGCAVQAAISEGVLDVRRLERWRKLQREDTHNSQSIAEARKREKQFGKMVSKTMNDKKRMKGR